MAEKTKSGLVFESINCSHSHFMWNDAYSCKNPDGCDFRITKGRNKYIFYCALCSNRVKEIIKKSGIESLMTKFIFGGTEKQRGKIIDLIAAETIAPAQGNEPIIAGVLTAEEKLIEDLFKQSPEGARCPYLKKDNLGPYCTKGLVKGDKISDERRYVCDSSSLQLWCLGKDRYQKCIFSKGEPFL